MYQDEPRLAYQAEVPVNWCPALGTVLATKSDRARSGTRRSSDRRPSAAQ